MRTLHLAAVLGLAACDGGGGDTVADITFDPCAALRVDVPGATPAQLAGIDAALALWQSQGELALATRDAIDAPMIQILFDDAAPNFHGGYDDEHGVIYLNLDLADAPLAIVAAHELGHAFGLAHVADRPSVMVPGNIEIAPTDGDRTAVEAVWGACPLAALRPENRQPATGNRQPAIP